MEHQNVVLLICVTALLPGVALAAGEGKQLRVASLSIMPAKWDKAANADKIERMVREAAKAGAKLVVTPEGVLEGYVVNEVIHEKDPAKKATLARKFNELAEPLDGPYVRRFCKLADELDIHLVLGFLERAEGKSYNTAALLDPDGRVVGVYHKSHFHQGYDVNPDGYTPGDTYPVFDLGPAKVGMMICFDRQLPEPARALSLAGADMVLCPSYGGTGDWNTRIMQVRAYENEVYVVFTHPKQSLIIDPDGKLMGEEDIDSILIRDVDLSRDLRTRQSIVRRRPETYDNLSGSEKAK